MAKVLERGLGLRPRLYAGSVSRRLWSCSVWLMVLYKWYASPFNCTLEMLVLTYLLSVT